MRIIEISTHHYFKTFCTWLVNRRTNLLLIINVSFPILSLCLVQGIVSKRYLHTISRVRNYENLNSLNLLCIARKIFLKANFAAKYFVLQIFAVDKSYTVTLFIITLFRKKCFNRCMRLQNCAVIAVSLEQFLRWSNLCVTHIFDVVNDTLISTKSCSRKGKKIS